MEETIHTEGLSGFSFQAPPLLLVLQEAQRQLWTFLLSAQAKQNTYLRNGPDSHMRMPEQQSSETTGHEKASNQWIFFCDFPEITHIAMADANVSILTQDNHCMVRVLASLLTLKQEACKVSQLMPEIWHTDILWKEMTNALGS